MAYKDILEPPAGIIEHSPVRIARSRSLGDYCLVQGRNDRDRRDRDRNGARGGGDRKQGHDDRRQSRDGQRRY